MPANHAELQTKLREMSLYDLQNELVETHSEQAVDLLLEEIKGRKRKDIIAEIQKDKLPNYFSQAFLTQLLANFEEAMKDGDLFDQRNWVKMFIESGEEL